MRLADDIVIRLDRQTIRLRPSLRAALRLERRHGFAGLFQALQDGNVSVMADVIRESATRPCDLPDVLDAIGGLPLGLTLEALTGPLLAHVAALAGLDPDAEPAPTDGPRITYAEHFERLFGIATGWLSWTPDAAWNATPAEIMAAYRGRLDMLRAIFGGKDDQPGGYDDTRDESGWSALRALAIGGAVKAR